MFRFIIPENYSAVTIVEVTEALKFTQREAIVGKPCSLQRRSAVLPILTL